jgi:hypothetical protein
MKLLKNAVILLCLGTSLSVHAQKKDKNKTIFTPPTIVKDDTGLSSEKKKQTYKSKQWRQGNEEVTGESKVEGKNKSPNLKKKQTKVPPPPPPPPPAAPIKE